MEKTEIDPSLLFFFLAKGSCTKMDQVGKWWKELVGKRFLQSGFVVDSSSSTKKNAKLSYRVDST